VPHVTTLHGESVADDWFWLRDKDDPRVRAYLEEENAWADAAMADTAGVQERLYDEMLARIKEVDVSAPYRKGGFWYYARTEEGRQYPILARKRGTLDAVEEILLDLNDLARDHDYFAVDAFVVSDDGSLLAFTIDTAGFREYTLYVKDLRRGAVGPHATPRVSSVAWARDGRTLFYVTDDDAKRPHRLWRRRIDRAEGALVYEEPDRRFSLQIRRTRSGEFLFLDADSHTANEVHYLSAGDPEGAFRVFLQRAPELEYELCHGGEDFWLRINDRGRNFRLVRCPVRDPRPERWREVLPHRDDVMLVSVEAFAHHLVAYERELGLERYAVIDLEDGARHEIDFPESAYSTFPDINAEYETHLFRFRYQSMITPPSIYDYDLGTRERTLVKRMEVLGGFDPYRYVVERTEAVAPDGVRVPVSLAYRRGTPRDGTAPLHLLGYGAYGYPLPALFSSNRLSLLDRGIICAIAHVRGGGEMGKAWHDTGRMTLKTNTFSYFIAAAEHLVGERYTAHDRIIVEGASAGGLLVGAVVNERPDLGRGAVMKVPFVDVVNTMLDTTLPLTVAEFEEWGNPSVPDDYHRMKAYCPYTNLSRKGYPSMLVKTSFQDSQVMYWEPAKYVAKLRALNESAPQVLLKVNFAAGHGGSSGRYDLLREVAFDVAWMFQVWGIEA
jgi:oligopeptidase B